MKRIAVVVAVGAAWTFVAGVAQALPVGSASVGNARGCVDQACTNQTFSWGGNAGGGSGTLDIVGNNLTFSITLASTTLAAIGGSDNGVSQIAFTNTTYNGSANLTPLVPGFFSIASGSATIAGTQTPTGAGSAGPFAASDALLSGSCTVVSATDISCGITFGAANDFNFPVNGQTRYFQHTMNVTAVPEPATAIMLGVGLVGLGLAGRRSRPRRD